MMNGKRKEDEMLLPSRELIVMDDENDEDDKDEGDEGDGDEDKDEDEDGVRKRCGMDYDLHCGKGKIFMLLVCKDDEKKDNDEDEHDYHQDRVKIIQEEAKKFMKSKVRDGEIIQRNDEKQSSWRNFYLFSHNIFSID